MKRIFTLIIAFAISSQMAQAGNSSLREQLENLNACWKNKDRINLPAETGFKPDEVGIISLHLSLVEGSLRKSPPENISAEQLSNRNHCLDVLHDYWTKGVFPKNLYHQKRTPYFIDKFGTACAVGQLIISTGYETLAQKISSENNYDYIKTLKVKYPEIKTWAEKFGFTVDELAWIQPAYVNCDTSCAFSAAIYTNAGQPPYTYLWSNGETSQNAFNLCPGETYTCIVTDANGSSISPVDCDMSQSAMMYPGTNQITTPAAVPFYIDLSSTLDDGNCNGTATVEVLHGTAPFSYYWTPGGQTYQTATGLCQGTYWVSVSDGNNCIKTDSVVVPSSVGVMEIEHSSLQIFPNPVSDKLIVHSEKMFPENSSIKICNAMNQIVLAHKLSSNISEIDVSKLESGTYFVVFNDEWKMTRRRFVKN